MQVITWSPNLYEAIKAAKKKSDKKETILIQEWNAVSNAFAMAKNVYYTRGWG